MAKKVNTLIEVTIKGNDKLIALRKEVELYSKNLKDLKKENKDVKNISDETARAFAEQETSLKKARREYGNAQKELKGFSETTKKSTGFVTKMAKSFGLAQIGATLFMRAMNSVRQAVLNAVNSFSDFEFQMAKVKAITGANEEEFKKLQLSAMRLGRTTFFTATQVAEMQESLSRLGFTTIEVLSAQEAILNLSTAMSSELGRTATIVAAAIRGFGVDADQTRRFVDVMGKSFTSSALDLEKFQTSMTKVSAIAADSGFTFEETTAMLGLLTDRGIEASIAGTSLRNILLKMQDPASDLSRRLGQTVHSGEDFIKALRTLKLEGAEMADVMGIVNIRQANAFTAFINSADALELFNARLEGANGATGEMAAIMEDTLKGAINRSKSAYEGFILAIENGDGVLSTTLKNLYDMSALFLNNWAQSFMNEKDLVEDLLEDELAFARDMMDQHAKMSKGVFSSSLEEELKQAVLRHESALEALNRKLEKEKDTAENAMFGIARKNAEEDAIETEKAIRIKEALLLRLNETINEEIEANKKKSKQAEESYLKELARQKDLIALQEDLLDQAKLMPQTTEAEITAKNKKIAVIETEISRLKALGKEQKKITGKTESPIADDFSGQAEKIAKQRFSIIEQEMFDKEQILKQQYIDGTISTEEMLNQKIFEMKAKHLQDSLVQEQGFLDSMFSANELVSNALIELKHKEKTSTEKTQEAKDKATQDEIQNVIMQSDTAQEAFSQLISMRINEILLDAMGALWKDESIPFVAKVGLAIGMKSLVTPLINSLLGGGGGQATGETVSGEDTFANGGLTRGGMFQGNSHANGGVKFRVGGRIHEAEGGEAIINKRSTSMFRPVLSAINSYNGNGVKFADGGLLNSGEKFAMGGELRSAQQLVSGGMGSSKVVIVESDMTEVQNRISAIESQATF